MIGNMTSAHFIFIPAVLLVGIVIGWVLGSRAAADAYAMELKRQRKSEREEESKPLACPHRQPIRQARRQPGVQDSSLRGVDRIDDALEGERERVGVVDADTPSADPRRAAGRPTRH